MYKCVSLRMYVICCAIIFSVAEYSSFNLMQASNLGVVFGPTLIRPEVETVAKINNIKYQNIIVEMMIDEKDKVSLSNLCVCVCVRMSCEFYVHR